MTENSGVDDACGIGYDDGSGRSDNGACLADLIDYDFGSGDGRGITGGSGSGSGYGNGYGFGIGHGHGGRFGDGFCSGFGGGQYLELHRR